MKKKKMKMKKMENGKWRKEKRTKKRKKRRKKQPDLRIQSTPIQSTPVVLHSTIYANLVFLPRIPIFSFIFILGIVTGITSRKALFSSSYKPSYFLSFGTDLLRDFLYIPFVYGLPNWEVWCVPMLILFVDVGFVIVDVVVVSIVIITSWLLATGLDWDGRENGKVGEVFW